MIISFPEKGEYKVEVYVDHLCIFTVYFDVKNATDKLFGICGIFKEKFGFIPIFPKKGLTEIENGFVQIRFSVKQSRSNILLQLYNIKKGTLDEENEFEDEDWYDYFTTDLPFNSENKEDDLNDHLVEDWVLVHFPRDGRWKVKIYFNDGDSRFLHGVDYYFDVTGTKNDNNKFSFLNLPINRTIISPKIQMEETFRLEPSTKIVIKEDSNFNFHVFSKFTVLALFENDKTDKSIIAEIISVKDKDNEDIKDHEISAPYLEKGYYKLIILEKESKNIIKQQYLITGKLHKESKEEKKLMKELKQLIEGKFDFLKDVPSSIRETVKNMVEKTIKDVNSNRINEKMDIFSLSYESSFDESKIQNLEAINRDLKTQIKDLNETISALQKEKEEQYKYSHSLEQEKNGIENRIEELKNELEKESKEKNEMKAILREFERKTNELNSKLRKLEKRNEETIKNMTKQKLESEQEIHKLTKIQQNQLKQIQKIEQENNLLNS